MKLYPINALGIQAYCSNIVIDPHDLNTVYFMSICGYQVTVKGIIANLLENYGISIEIDGIEHYLVRSSFGYKALLKKLPSGLVHAVLFPKLALPKNSEEEQNSFFVFTEQSKRDQLLSLFYRHLDEKTDIPLHPSWDSWLWQVFKEQEGWLTKLKTLVGTYQGHAFKFNPKQLSDFISNAIRKKIPEIIDCMRWKGGDRGE